MTLFDEGMAGYEWSRDCLIAASVSERHAFMAYILLNGWSQNEARVQVH